MSDDGEDLGEYREKVVVELTRRSERVRRLEQEIASKSLQLEELQHRRQVIAGDTGRVLAQESYRAVVSRAIVRLKRERVEALDELQVARRRLEQVDAEIAAEVDDDIPTPDSRTDGDPSSGNFVDTELDENGLGEEEQDLA